VSQHCLDAFDLITIKLKDDGSLVGHVVEFAPELLFQLLKPRQLPSADLVPHGRDKRNLSEEVAAAYLLKNVDVGPRRSC